VALDTRSDTHTQSASSGRGIENSSWQNTTLTRDKHPCPRRDSSS